MTKVLLVDVQQEKTMKDAILTLIEVQELGEDGVTLQGLYDLTKCSMIERVILGKLKNGNTLDLIIDEEGTFGQWSRGIKIKNDIGYEYTLFGNCVFVQCNSEGDWIGWESTDEMYESVSPYLKDLQYFEVADE